MKFGSVCSGVEAASLAWEPLGWNAQFVAEVEPFPCAVLQHRWPDVPNLGDMTANDFIDKARAAGTIDVLVGGTPCQSFSVAGLRRGLDDERGNLALKFCRIADQVAPRWVVWENVAGVLSSNRGRDFGSIVGALAECGYNLAWRILDAQNFGVPQRRRRVFLVGHLGADERGAAAVLFERESLCGHPAPRREAREGIAPAVTSGPPFSRTGNERVECEAIVPLPFTPSSHAGYREGCRTLRGNGGDLGGGSETLAILPIWRASDQANAEYGVDQTGALNCINARETPVSASGKSLPLGAQDRGHAIGFIPKNSAKTRSMGEQEEISPCLDSSPHAVAFTQNQCGDVLVTPHAPAVSTNGNATGRNTGKVLLPQMQVRRLTPRECERLQGMPDDHTRIPWRGKDAEDCPDGPRYKAIGNSMAVPVMRWLGERIQQVDALLTNAAGRANLRKDTQIRGPRCAQR